jgi:hypothetical protein
MSTAFYLYNSRMRSMNSNHYTATLYHAFLHNRGRQPAAPASISCGPRIPDFSWEISIHEPKNENK